MEINKGNKIGTLGQRKRFAVRFVRIQRSIRKIENLARYRDKTENELTLWDQLVTKKLSTVSEYIDLFKIKGTNGYHGVSRCVVAEKRMYKDYYTLEKLGFVFRYCTPI